MKKVMNRSPSCPLFSAVLSQQLKMEWRAATWKVHSSIPSLFTFYVETGSR